MYKSGEISRAQLRKLRVKCPPSMVQAIVAYNQNPSQQTSYPMLDELKMLQQVLSQQQKVRESILEQKESARLEADADQVLECKKEIIEEDIESEYSS